MKPSIIALLSLSLLAAATRAAELRIPLTVRETAGQYRIRENVSTGVPLLPGQCRDVKKLRLLDAAGKEVPAQFRALARWWSKDNSLRWVLVDFRATLGGFKTRTFTLTDGRDKAYPSPLTVKQTAESITVTTGVAEFVINRRKFNLFERVRIDVNGDGQYAGDEECVSPSAQNGSVVEDTYGLKYLSSEGTAEVRVEQAGPVRVCVVAKGVHRAPGGKGYSKGMYGYDIRMHFLAGSSLVRFDANINNSLPRPIGSPTFEDHSIVVKLNIAPTINPNKGAADRKSKLALYATYGVAPVVGDMKAGRSVVIYQDSNGSETWKVNPGIEGQGKLALSSFRGYRIYLKSPDGRKVLASGDHARGLTQFWGGKFGAVVIPRYFWQQFPKAIEVGHDGTLRVGVLPREYKAVHWLPDAGGAGQEFWIHFFARGLEKPARPEYPRDNNTRSNWHALMRDRPWPHCIGDSLVPGPLVALSSKEHYAACGALADVGPYLPWKSSPGFPLAVTERRYFMTDYLKGNAYGWQVFGCRWEEYKGHSPWNYEPIGSTDFLYKFVNAQHPSWLEFGRRRGMHSRNLRACKIDGTKVFDFKTWGAFRQNNVCEDYAKRAKVTGNEIAKYSQGKYGRAEWVLPNPAHMNLDEVLDLYCLFGDTRALEVSRNAAAVGGAYVGMPDVKVGIHRATGWCFRTLIRYKDLTGSAECDAYVKQALDNFWKVARQYRSVTGRIAYKNTWFYNVFGRSVVIAYNVTGDERMRDLAIGLTQDRHSKSGHPTLNAFSWDQTGRKVYYSLKAGKRGPKQYWGGYFPACDDYMWKKPRPDKKPPAAITNLVAQAGGGGAVTLTWTAPGDDGAEGTATVYQVKYDNLAIRERADGGGSVNFWGAENASGEPRPQKAGSKETFTVKGLRPGSYYFAMKARDEYNNESAISNVVKVEVQ